MKSDELVRSSLYITKNKSIQSHRKLWKYSTCMGIYISDLTFFKGHFFEHMGHTVAFQQPHGQNQ